MKAQIERIRSYVARIRRNPDASSSMNTLAISEVADCLESIDERLAKLEAQAAHPIIAVEMSPRTSNLIPNPARYGDEWAIGSKV